MVLLSLSWVYFGIWDKNLILKEVARFPSIRVLPVGEDYFNITFSCLEIKYNFLDLNKNIIVILS